MMQKIKVVGFDADDTLWVNELNYKETEESFCALMKDYLPSEEISKALFKTEVQNMELYGYGAKAFFLSIIETAISISDAKLDPEIISSIIRIGKPPMNVSSIRYTCARTVWIAAILKFTVNSETHAPSGF